METDFFLCVCFNLLEFPLTLKTKKEEKRDSDFYLSINDNGWLMMQFIFSNSNSQKNQKKKKKRFMVKKSIDRNFNSEQRQEEDIEWPWLEFKFQFTLFCFFFPLKLIEKSKVKIGKKRRELRSFFVVCTEIWDCE